MEPEIIAAMEEEKLAEEWRASQIRDVDNQESDSEHSTPSQADTNQRNDDELDNDDDYQDRDIDHEDRYQEEYLESARDSSTYSQRESCTDTLSKVTPRTWDSWTSSMCSSPRRLLKRNPPSFHWSDYPIPWEKIIDRERPGANAVTNVTTLYRFRDLLEPRHGTRFGTQRKLQAGLIKNPQWPTDSITCLNCGKSGHLCHECKSKQKKKKPISGFGFLNLPAMSDVEEGDEADVSEFGGSETGSRDGTVDKSAKPSVVGDLKGTFFIGHLFGKRHDQPPLDVGLASPSPILCQMERIHVSGSPVVTQQCRTHENYEALLMPHGGAQFGSCMKLRPRVKGFKNTKTTPSNCNFCGSPRHTTDKCSTYPYCRFNSKRRTKGGGIFRQQSAQMSFRIRGQQRNEADLDTPECDECHRYRTGTNIYSAGSSLSDSEDTGRRRTRNADPYEELERGCDEWFRTMNRGFSQSANLLESEESVAIICGKVNGMQTTMLLDTGSSISAITESFAQQLHLETWYTDDVLVVTLANTHVERYPERMCIVTLEIGDLEICEELNVLPGQIYNVTLGKNWLKSHMAICDYGLDILRLPGSRPIRMGVSAPVNPLKSVLKKKKCRKPKRQLAQSTESRPYYPSLRTLLFLGGWLPPSLRTE